MNVDGGDLEGTEGIGSSIQRKNDECPVIRVPIEKKHRLHRQWSRALIVKLIGHSVGYNFIFRRLKAIWHVVLAMDVIDVGNDCYIVRFADSREYEKVIF
ncbi:hypothetical protein DITRI_Ditri14bG0092700 [Diplodiscus trichospermus]